MFAGLSDRDLYLVRRFSRWLSVVAVVVAAAVVTSTVSPLSVEAEPTPQDVVVDETPPSAVRNLKAKDPKYDAVEIAWNPPAVGTPVGYKIYRDNEYVHAITRDALKRVIVWYDPDATPGTAYVYTVQPYARADDGSQINGPATSVRYEPDGSGATGTEHPRQLQDLRALLAHPGIVKLAWADPNDEKVTGFLIERDGAKVDEIGPTRTFWTAPGPADGTFSFSVQAFYGAGEDRAYGPKALLQVSASADGMAMAVDKVGPVEELTATQTPYQLEVVVNWKASSTGPIPSGYNIERNGQPVATVPTPHYFDATVEADKTYEYSINPYLKKGDDVVFAPKMTSPTVTVEATPESIDPNAPTDLSASQLNDEGHVGLSWTAPVGWEQGLVDFYQVHRNGQIIGTIEEPNFDGALGHPDRNYVDADAPIGTQLAYSVVAISSTSTDTTNGERSPVVIITSQNTRPDENDSADDPSHYGGTVPNYPTQQDVPKNFIKAIEVVFNVEGIEAERLGGEFYTIYVLNQDPTTEFKPLLHVFNKSIQNLRGQAFGIDQSAFLRGSSHTIAKTLIDKIGTEASKTHLLATIPGYEPDGLDELKALGEWRVLSTKSLEQRAQIIAEQAPILDTALANLEATSKPKKHHFRAINAPTDAIAYAALGIDGCSIKHDDCAAALHKFSNAIRDGWNPTSTEMRTRESSESGGKERVTIQRSSQASDLFIAATPDERAEFFGIEPAAWEFASPFTQISEGSSQNLRRLKNAKIRKLISIVVTVFVTFISTRPDVGWAAGAAVNAFGAYISMLILTGSTSKAEKKAILSGILAGGLKFYRPSEGVWWEVVVSSTIKVLITELTYEEPDLERTFVDAVTASLLKREIGEELWAKLEPSYDALSDMLLAAVLDGATSWEELAPAFEAALFEAVGREIGAFNGSYLSPEWKQIGDILGPITARAILSQGNRNELREFYYASTVPALIDATGNGLLDSLGKEEFFNRLLPDLTEIGLRGSADADFDPQELFDNMVYRRAAEFLSRNVHSKLLQANAGQPSHETERLTEALRIAITYGGDAAERERQLIKYVGETNARCGNEERNYMFSSVVDTLISSDSTQTFEDEAYKLVASGASLALAC